MPHPRAASGIGDARWVPVNIDDNWEDKRGAPGYIHLNLEFPHTKALADYVRSKALRLEMHPSPADKTCAGYQGTSSKQTSARRVSTFSTTYARPPQATATRQEMSAAYTWMHDALEKTGRPIVLSLCGHGWNKVLEGGPSVGGDPGRNSGEVSGRYSVAADIGSSQNGLERFAGPGRWKDPEMLVVGSAGVNAGHSRVGDKSRGDAAKQDPLSRKGHRVAQEGTFEVWMEPMADRSREHPERTSARTGLPKVLC